MTSLAELRAKHNENLEKESNRGGGGAGNKEWASFEMGDNIIRILPGRDEPLEFFVEGHVHKFQDAEGNWKSYKCRKSAGEECPMCDLYYDLWDRHKALNLGKDAEGKQIKSKFGNLATQVKPKARFYVRALIRALEAAEDENPVRFVAMSQQLFNKAMGAVLDPEYQDEEDPDNSTIISLERGNDFNVRITKQGQYNSFDESRPKIKKTRAGSPQDVAAWMEAPLDLNKLVEVDSYEKGKEIQLILESSLDSNASSKKEEKKVEKKSDDSDGEEDFNKELKV